MQSSLSAEHVQRLVVESARSFRPAPLTIETPEISERNDDAGATWVIRTAVKRPEDRKAWAMTRLRFTQAIRDRLLELGDDRYPVLEVLSPEEWRAAHHA